MVDGQSHNSSEIAALAQRVETARGRLPLQHDAALFEVLSDAEIEAERKLAQWVRTQRRAQRRRAVQDELSAEHRLRKTTSAIHRADDADARWHRRALAARRRVANQDARLAQLYRRAEWSSRALIGVVVLGMIWAGVNVQHNLVPSGDMSDPLYWLSYGIEAMISIPIITIMVVATTAARWGRELPRGKVIFFEAALLGTTVALNAGPHLAAGNLGRAAEYSIAPIMVGVVIWLHAWVSARYAQLIDSVPLPDAQAPAGARNADEPITRIRADRLDTGAYDPAESPDRRELLAASRIDPAAGLFRVDGDDYRPPRHHPAPDIPVARFEQTETVVHHEQRVTRATAALNPDTRRTPRQRTEISGTHLIYDKPHPTPGHPTYSQLRTRPPASSPTPDSHEPQAPTAAHHTVPHEHSELGSPHPADTHHGAPTPPVTNAAAHGPQACAATPAYNGIAPGDSRHGTPTFAPAAPAHHGRTASNLPSSPPAAPGAQAPIATPTHPATPAPSSDFGPTTTASGTPGVTAPANHPAAPGGSESTAPAFTSPVPAEYPDRTTNISDAHSDSGIRTSQATRTAAAIPDSVAAAHTVDSGACHGGFEPAAPAPGAAARTDLPDHTANHAAGHGGSGFRSPQAAPAYTAGTDAGRASEPMTPSAPVSPVQFEIEQARIVPGQRRPAEQLHGGGRSNFHPTVASTASNGVAGGGSEFGAPDPVAATSAAGGFIATAPAAHADRATNNTDAGIQEAQDAGTASATANNDGGHASGHGATFPSATPPVAPAHNGGGLGSSDPTASTTAAHEAGNGAERGGSEFTAVSPAATASAAPVVGQADGTVAPGHSDPADSPTAAAVASLMNNDAVHGGSAFGEPASAEGSSSTRAEEAAGAPADAGVPDREVLSDQDQRPAVTGKRQRAAESVEQVEQLELAVTEPSASATTQRGRAARTSASTGPASKRTDHGKPQSRSDSGDTEADSRPTAVAASPTALRPRTASEVIREAAEAVSAEVLDVESIESENDDAGIWAVARAIAHRGMSPIPVEQLAEILTLADQSWTPTSIGAEVGLPRTEVAQILEYARKVRRPYAVIG